MPFCAEKRPYFLSEIEKFFVALLVKQSLSSSRKYDGYRGVAQFCVATQLATPLGTKNKNTHTMNSDPKNGSDFDPDNIIAVTLDDLSEDDRRELDRKVEEDRAETIRLTLAGYQKTRNGVVKKVATPSPSDLLGAEVKKPTDEIAHLIDVSVASKYGSDVADMSRTLQAVVNKFEEFKVQLEDNIPRHVRSVVLQMNDENSAKQPMPPESSRLFNLLGHTHTPGASASTTQHAHVPLNNNLSGQKNYASSSANDFVSGAAPPIVTTSAPQNYGNNNRSGILNPDLQQPFSQTVAHNTPPLQPVGTGVPCGPVPSSYFSGSPLQTSHAQSSLPEYPPHACVTSAAQTNSPQSADSFKDQLAGILREFGLESKGRARAY